MLLTLICIVLFSRGWSPIITGSILCLALCMSPCWWMSFPGGSDDREFTCQCRRLWFSPWVKKVPWRRKWQPTPVFLPGRSQGQRSLVGYSPQGGKDTTEQLSTHTLLSLVGPEQQAGSPSERELAVADQVVVLPADCCRGLGWSCTWCTFWSYLPVFSGCPWGQWLFIFLICKVFIKLTVGPSSVFGKRYNFGCIPPVPAWHLPSDD